MADGTPIEWTHRPGTRPATWNPVVGCDIVSPGCAHCYAMRMARRIEAMAEGAGRETHYAGTTKLVKGRQEAASAEGARGKQKAIWTGLVRAAPEAILTQPLRWVAPRTIFVSSMSDLFHEGLPDEVIDRVFAVMALCPHHTFIVLTKRAARMRAYLCTRAGDWSIVWPDANPPGSLRISRHEQRLAMRGAGWPDAILRPTFPLPNVWLGVSAERQQEADQRIPDLLATPAAIRFVSAEPLLGPIDFERLGTTESIRSAMPTIVAREERGRPRSGDGSVSGMQIDAVGSPGSSITFFQTPDHMGGFTATSPRGWPKLDWIIVGGESGPGARPMHPDWARSIRDQCASAGTAFFFKQWGAWAPWQPSAETWLYPTGATRTPMVGEDWPEGAVPIANVGKRRAGRLLDGVEHSAFPEARR